MGASCVTWPPRREDLVVRAVAAREQLRDLLECAWQGLEAAVLESLTWRAALGGVG